MIIMIQSMNVHLVSLIRKFGVCSLILLHTSCNGIMGWIYDEPAISNAPVKGQLVIDATSWENWYYVDLNHLKELTEQGDTMALLKAQMEFEPYPIPMTLTSTSDGKSGQYMYWFDVFGEGIKKNEFRSYTPCDAQPEPREWTFAVHRNNVRTNNAGVFETPYSSMKDLPESSLAFRDKNYRIDEWSENEVWDSQEQMLNCLVPSQGIKVNKLLSSWMTVNIPPIPPSFSFNNHVFILRLKDGTYAALQLENYISPTGKKCYLTINYIYPY